MNLIHSDRTNGCLCHLKAAYVLVVLLIHLQVYSD